MTSLRLTHICSTAVLLLTASGGAGAASVTTTLPVTANVLSACVVQALPVNFGGYDPTVATPLEAVGSITVICTTGTAFTVALGPGQHSTSVTTRQMQGATAQEFLNYGLYRDAARSQNWGNTAGTVQGTTAGVTPTTYTVFGTIPPGQNVGTDVFADTVLVTVNY